MQILNSWTRKPVSWWRTQVQTRLRWSKNQWVQSTNDGKVYLRVSVKGKSERFYVSMCHCVTKILMLECLLNWPYLDMWWIFCNRLYLCSYWQESSVILNTCEFILQKKFSLSKMFVFIIAYITNSGMELASWHQTYINTAFENFLFSDLIDNWHLK